MADSQKKKVLSALNTALAGASGIATAVVATNSVEMDLYTESQTPLAQIIPTVELVEYETAYVAMWRPVAIVTVFFVGDDYDYEERETVRKVVLDALGADSTLGGTCADCRVQSIVSGGSFPLFEESFTLEILFERHRANA